MFDLANKKLATVANMNSLGWDVSGEAWKCRKMFFEWELELVKECVDLVTHVVLQVEEPDRWAWKLHYTQ